VLLTGIIQSQSESAFFLEKTEKTARVQREVINELLAAERDQPGQSFVNGEGVFDADHPLAGDRWQKKVQVVDFLLGLIKVRQLVYRITWDAGRGQGEHSFESAILTEVK